MNNPASEVARVPRVVVLDHATASSAYPAPSCVVRGGVTGRIGHGHSIWAITGELAEGAELEWGAAHGDEVVYVFDGALETGGNTCGNRGCVIVESNAKATLRALTTTRFIHFGPADPLPPADGPCGAASPTGHGVRVVAEGESNPMRHVGPDGTIYDQRFYAEGTTPTCRLALFGVTASQASDAPLHSHTQDEIIHVVRGELHVGKLVIGPGMSVAIKAEQRYGFTTPGLLEFLNYRRDASYVVQGDKEPMLEIASERDQLRGID